MKKSRKSSFFIVAAIVLVFSYFAIFGLSTWYGDMKQVYIKGVADIRWGIDIQGGVEAVFMPEGDVEDISEDDMEKAEQIIKYRLAANNITDAEIDRDNVNKQVIVRFPWQSGISDFDPVEQVEELGETAMLTFCQGTDNTNVILSGSADVKSASAGMQDTKYVVQLELTDAGKTKFAEATSALAGTGEVISIWLDDQMISSPTVNTAITDGHAIIEGDFDAESAQELADKINGGSLPFKISADDSKLSIVTPTLGSQSLTVMLIAGLIAFAIISIMMVLLYRAPGAVAVICLIGQVSFIFACVSGFFGGASSFTLTIPGIAGIILSIGMGVDCNVIIGERIKEEVRSGKSIEGAVRAGYNRGVTAVIDGNVTVIIVSVILMGVFGSPSSIWAKILSPLTFMFDSSITGEIYSFGYTLLIGAIANFIIGVVCSRFMIRGIAAFKALKKPWLFGGVRNGK